MRTTSSFRLAASAVMVASYTSASPAQQQPLYDLSRLFTTQKEQQLAKPTHDGEHFWDRLSSYHLVLQAAEDAIRENVQYLETSMSQWPDDISDWTEETYQKLSNVKFEDVFGAESEEEFVEIDGHHHDFPEHTIYQLISVSNYTRKFHNLVKEYPDIVDLLNSTSAGNHTLFVPVDEAFAEIPDHHEKPSKEFIEALIWYHIGVGNYGARRVLGTYTVPTALNEKFLGDEPQRLRTSVGLSGVRINFYSKIIAADIGATNGIIHGIRRILVPPPFLGRILSLFPGKFSTLLLAYEKTDFAKYLHTLKTNGTTLFAPSNTAFSLLGPGANAFLFNTEKGLKYLDAILKYHIAANATLYSDAFYDKTTSGTDVDDDVATQSEHFDLQTLLGDAHVGVDIARIAGFRVFRINGYTHVTIHDGIGKNGVLQVVDKVLIPPHKSGHTGDYETSGEIEVEDLIERLSPYVEE